MSIAITSKRLKDFVQESLNIESIFREPTQEELEETHKFIHSPQLFIPDVIQHVKVFQPNAVLRTDASHRVFIGGREAPVGGEYLVDELSSILDRNDPWMVHTHYEYLHPFTDGNGRSGRAIWANKMLKQGYQLEYKFLQMYYYQTLSKYSSGEFEIRT